MHDRQQPLTRVLSQRQKAIKPRARVYKVTALSL